MKSRFIDVHVFVNKAVCHEHSLLGAKTLLKESFEGQRTQFHPHF